MSSTNGAGKHRPIFSAQTRLELLKQVVGKPSGVIVELGGLQIDLVAVSVADDEQVIGLAQTFGSIYDDVMSKQITSFAEIIPQIGGRYRDLKDILKRMVHDSVEVDGDEGEAAFDEWWNALPLVETMQALASATLSANRLASLGKRLAAEAAKLGSDQKPDENSDLPTPSATS
jgi:hypothetical protein